MFAGLQLLLETILFAALAGFGWLGLRSSHDFFVVVRNGEVSFRGRFPIERRATVSQFLANDIGVPGPYKVFGTWRAGRVLRLRFRGKLPATEHQRIRNFLAITLR